MTTCDSYPPPGVDDLNLTEHQRAALDAITSSGGAWIPTGDEVQKAVFAELSALGLVELWEHDRDGDPFQGGPLVTLSAIGAHRLGATLVEGIEECPSWRLSGRDELGDPVLPETPHRVTRWGGARRLKYPELVADRALSPLDAAIMREEYLMREAVTEDGRVAIDLETGAVRREIVELW